MALLPCLLAPAGAVFTAVPVSLLGAASITLQVGTATAGSIDNLVFDVTGTRVMPSATPISNATSVPVRVVTSRTALAYLGATVRVTVDSSGGLVCVGGSGCGSTIIPFSSISWVSTNPDASGEDVQSGAFTGSTAQVIAQFTQNSLLEARGFSNQLLFTYANSTVYPAGQYKGRVVFTATML